MIRPCDQRRSDVFVQRAVVKVGVLVYDVKQQFICFWKYSSM